MPEGEVSIPADPIPARAAAGRLRLTQRQFHAGLGLLLLFYLTIEVGYVLHLPLAMDEFQGADTIAQFEKGMPYRDFLPYKTVLGYYIQLPALHLGSDPWSRLILVKLEMAILNTLLLGAAALALRRRFTPEAVWLGLLLTICMSTFLERSAELRVDMLTSWAGLGSLLLLLERRHLAAGAFAGLSFLVSQKGVYYVVAGAAALGAAWLIGRGARDEATALIRFITAWAAVILAYLVFWTLWSSWPTVVRTTFWNPRRIVLKDLYDVQVNYWWQTLVRNPAYYLLGILGLVSLLQRRRAAPGKERDRVLLVTYGLALAGLAVLHKQAWPYFFVLIIPTTLVVIVALLDDKMRMPGNQWPLGLSPLALAGCIVFGVILPLQRLPVNLSRDSGFQRHMILLADSILEEPDSYLAGTDMIYGRRQPVTLLRWIDYPKRRFLEGMSPEALGAVIDSLDRSQVKLVVDNYRIQGLPRQLRDYLEMQFVQLWGNLLVYGPAVQSGRQDVFIQFGGRYSVAAPAGVMVDLDGRELAPGGTVLLERGLHRSSSSASFRLKLLPDGWDRRADPRYSAPRDFFPRIYSY